ncbi:MAG: trigger factor [Culicoidibacterales bacterium]
MSVKVEKLENSRVKLTFSISEEVFATAMDKAFAKVVTEVSEPGFRKGKMPRALFEKKYGKESLYHEALDMALPVAYPAALDEAGIDPVAMPTIDLEAFEPANNNIVVVAEVAVRPEVTLGDYKGLSIEPLATEVTDADMDAEIMAAREKAAEMLVKADGEVVVGDTAVIDFEGFKDGVAFEGGKGENHSLAIGSGSFIPGFEEQLVGMKNGETREIDVTFPEAYHSEDLAGQPVKFVVTVHEIKERIVPELSDELVADLGMDGVETVEQFTDVTRTRLVAEKAQAAESHTKNELVRVATENASMELAPEMVDTEIDNMIKNFEQQLSQQGLNFEQYVQFTGQDVAGIREQMKEQAETNIRTGLTLEAIAAAEGIDATDEEADAELAEMAAMYGMEVEQLRPLLGGNIGALKHDIKMKKVIELLVSSAN